MITLRPQDLAAIRSAAATAYPEECCGLLVGRREGTSVIVTRVVAAANVARERSRDRFELDPKVRIDTERSLRGAAEQVVGHYHSHPDHPAEPSATDRSMVYEPDLIWLIANVERSGANAIRAWRFDESTGAFDEIELG